MIDSNNIDLGYIAFKSMNERLTRVNNEEYS